MKYHKAKDGTWRRCIASKRKGQSVTLCPIGDRSHVIGRAGIAVQGGGIEARWEDGNQVKIAISPMDADGRFTATSHKGMKRVYTADGKLLKLRDRARTKGHAGSVDAVKYEPESVPVDKQEWADSLTDEQLKLWSLGDAAEGADLPKLAKLSGIPVAQLRREANFMGFTDEQYAELLSDKITTSPEAAPNRAAVQARLIYRELIDDLTN